MAEEPAGGKIAAEAEEAKGAAAEKKKKDESLRKKIPPTKVLAQVAATLTATFLLSLAGKTGTFAGLIGGSALSSVLPTSYDHFLGKGTKAVKARYQELRLTNMEPDAAMRQARRENRESFFQPVHWKVLGASFVIILLGTTIAIAVTEAAAHKPVYDLVTGKAGSGSTFTGGRTVTVTPPPVVIAPSPAFTPYHPYSPPSFSNPSAFPETLAPTASVTEDPPVTPPAASSPASSATSGPAPVTSAPSATATAAPPDSPTATAVPVPTPPQTASLPVPPSLQPSVFAPGQEGTP